VSIPEGFPAVASAGPRDDTWIVHAATFTRTWLVLRGKGKHAMWNALENAGRALWTCSVSPCRYSKIVPERPTFFPAFFHEAGPELHFPEHLLSRPSRHGNNLVFASMVTAFFFFPLPLQRKRMTIQDSLQHPWIKVSCLL